MTVSTTSDFQRKAWWMLRTYMKRTAVVMIALLICIYWFIDVEVEYYTWRNRLDLDVPDIQMVTLPTSTQKPTPPKYGMFLYLGCTASPFASVLWHVTQAVKVCDRSNSDQLCDVKMSNDYTYDELGLKSVEWLGSDRFRQMTDQNEIIVKLDDDTIISKDIMDGLVESFSKSKCKFAGIMRRRQEDGLYWSSGPLMLVKTNHLRQQLQNNFDRLRYNTKHEDVGFSDMLSIRNPEDVCNVDLSLFRHRYYEDSRMTIRYKPYVKCK